MEKTSMASLPFPPSSSSTHNPGKLIIETSFSSIGFFNSRSSISIIKSKSKSNTTSNRSQELKPIVVSGNPPTFVSAPGRRIIAVGDVHGDLAQTRCALEMAGLLSPDGLDLWTGGQTVLIQLGDILDRGQDEIAILSLFRSLDIQAKAHGGAVFQINGNHETMNVEGDFRYVDSGAFDECVVFLEYLLQCQNNWEEAFVSWIAVSQKLKQQQQRTVSWAPWDQGQRQKARSILLKPGGALAHELARHSVVLKVNDWVFCHGGILPHHVEYGIEKINRQVSEWMKGSDGSSIPFIATRGYDSVVWNRLYSRPTNTMDDDDFQIKQILEETLQAVGAKAMVVGHTPQFDGVNCKYDCSIWRVDVGMSSGVLNSRPEVLEINDNYTRVLKSETLRVVDYT